MTGRGLLGDENGGEMFMLRRRKSLSGEDGGGEGIIRLMREKVREWRGGRDARRRGTRLGTESKINQVWKIGKLVT